MSPLYLLKVTILTVVCVCGVTYSQTPLWMRRKPVCPPAYKINVAMRFDGRPNFLRGPCSISGPRRDTCRRRMSCCENSRGVHLCIRARVYQPKYRTGSKSHPQSPPPPPPVPVQSSIMLNDMDFGSSLCPNALAMHGNSGKACGNYDKLHTPCQDTFMDCPGDRVCCKDPCYKGKGSPKLCFPLPSQSPFASFPLGGNFLSNDIHYLPLMNTHQKKSNEPPTTKLPPTVPLVTANLVAKEDDSKCPKPDIRCSEDGTECAVGCPAYDKSFTECKETSDCAQNRVCCQDPCPNSPLKLCFPDNEKVSRQKTAISKPAIQPPPQSTVMVDEEVKADRKKKLQNLVCPIGDLSSCIGWVAEPGKNGTGTCVSQKDCAEDRVCCKITECFDGLKHCVKQIKESALRKGCPTPSYFKFSPSKEQKLIKCAGDKDCTGNRLCCQLDVYGTKGCTPSNIN